MPYLCSDMYINTTFMRYGHCPGGIIGITVSEPALKRWTLSLHTCSRLIQDLNSLRDKDEDTTNRSVHNEERAAHIITDAEDRKKIWVKLDICINELMKGKAKPMEVYHTDGLLNIVSRSISPDAVNVDDAVSVRREHMPSYEMTLPEGFNG